MNSPSGLVFTRLPGCSCAPAPPGALSGYLGSSGEWWPGCSGARSSGVLVSRQRRGRVVDGFAGSRRLSASLDRGLGAAAEPLWVSPGATCERFVLAQSSLGVVVRLLLPGLREVIVKRHLFWSERSQFLSLGTPRPTTPAPVPRGTREAFASFRRFDPFAVRTVHPRSSHPREGSPWLVPGTSTAPNSRIFPSGRSICPRDSRPPPGPGRGPGFGGHGAACYNPLPMM